LTYELFKPSKYADSLLLSILKKWEVLDASFFVGDVIFVVGLGFFGLRHRALGPKLKGQTFFLKRN